MSDKPVKWFACPTRLGWRYGELDIYCVRCGGRCEVAA